MSVRQFKHEFAALTATGATPGVVVGRGGSYPDKHTVEAVITGSPTTVICSLEGSLDGDTWFELSSTGGMDVTLAANRMFHVVNRPVQKVRVNLTTLTAGTSPTVTFRYLGVAN